MSHAPVPRNRAERRHLERVDRLAYSPAEAAEAIGISRAKLYELLEAGELRSVKIGRRRLIRAADLESLLDAGGVTANGAA